MLGLGFKEFESVKRTISGIEVVKMIKKNQLVNPESSTLQFIISLFEYSNKSELSTTFLISIEYAPNVP